MPDKYNEFVQPRREVALRRLPTQPQLLLTNDFILNQPNVFKEFNRAATVEKADPPKNKNAPEERDQTGAFHTMNKIGF